MFWQQRLLSTVLIGIVAYIARSWFLERLRNSIRHEYDKKIEILKSDLNLTAIEHQIRFGRVYEQVAQTIAETYARLKKLHLAVGEYVKAWEGSADAPKDERRIAAAKAMQEVNEYYVPRRIFVRRDVADKINKLRDRLYEISMDFRIGVEDTERETGKPDIHAWVATYKAMSEEIKPQFEAIESDFQQLLGIEVKEQL